MTDARAVTTAGRGVTFAHGFRAGAAKAGVKHGRRERLDVALIVSERPCAAAAVFTTNQVIAAPCVVTRRHVERGPLRAIVVNSGNANACTGEQGERDAITMAEAAAAVVGCSPYEVAVASTGVIGFKLPIERIAAVLPEIELTETGWDDTSRAMMTTDTRPKVTEREVHLGAGTVRIGGIAKGAGMIHPNMATLLAFVTTDAAVDADDLRRIVSRAADSTFNAISIDGDTSTNDTLLVLANGASGVTPKGDDAAAFEDAVREVCAELARMIVADGEGATKIFEVRVRGAASAADARLAARTITNSNLVRTAIHGGDPNWGRVLAAAGRSGARVDDRRASVRIGDLFVYRDGAPLEVADAEVRALFAEKAVAIEVLLGLGDGEATAWGCDLSADYVRINAEYMT
ncbi:MAG TPA: bifunctional glutamate N-acetyltransferase/amino-acid acetyltransferase ArgJ [Candidatus Limnocylindria bacterium]|nr:bifunctional glutamate N-acetyltransferase/amino-acid acetyltransferase ArgJ [Candidatus Limnocylindria bacterium]